MSTEIFLKGLFAAIFSLTFAWMVYSRYDVEDGGENASGDQRRYQPYVPGFVLPLFLAVLVGLYAVSDGGRAAQRVVLSFAFGIFLHISVYYVVLMAALPLLRRHFSARACAMLWMIPNYLYITEQSYMELPMPRLVIRAPGNLAWVLLEVWAVGFGAVLLWKILSHLAFRRRILRHAEPAADPEVLAVWTQELERARFKKPKYKLVCSPDVTTPLSVGLFQRGIRVVLPERTYSREELTMILRHELVHIGREDAWSKFFLVFCTAMCWFNPLMWIAMRKSADDLELSCDETVLAGCGKDDRRRYAGLLLETAGDERGFTTCLSATASALRYRLKNVVGPPRKRSGALLVGAVFFALCMSCGYVALAYDGSTGAEAIYHDRDPAAFSLTRVEAAHDPYQTVWLYPDQEAFHAYMSSLELYRLTGNYSFQGSGRTCQFLYDTPEGTLAVVLCDEALKVVPLYGKEPTAQWYYIPGGTDWERLDEIVVAAPALNLSCLQEDGYRETAPAALYELEVTADGQTQQRVAPDPLLDGAPGGLFGYDISTVTLEFSRPPVSDFRVEVESWDKAVHYSLSQSDLEDPNCLPLAPYDARYTVYADFAGENGATLHAVFRFDAGDFPD